MNAPKSSSECVKVCVRCRPLSPQEEQDNRKIIVTISPGRGEMSVRNPKGEVNEPPKLFTFDYVYDWNSTQDQVYNETACPIVDSVLEGYNGTIFAYGQTGTGKTFTMEGVPDPHHLRGIIPRAFEHVFKTIDASSNIKQFLVRASMLELYNEEIRDLLAKNPKNKLELREKPDVGVYVKDLSAFMIQDVQEMQEKLALGRRNRAVGETKMNQDSSRSHCLFSITVEASDVGQDGEQHIRMGKLNLVDLAGSERQSKTHASGDRFKEAININQSLTTLGNVISALVDSKSSHVPYRDSKLTRLLQDSLGGNTKTVMIANLGPADWNFDETLSTLRYANRAKSIKNKPKINEDPKDTMLRQFQEEILKLKEQLEAQLNGQSVEGGGTVVHKEVVEKIVKVQDEAKIREIEEKLAKEKEEITKRAEEERQKIESQKNLAEEEKQKLLIALKEKEDAQKASKDNQENLVKKLKKMEEKLLVGTKAMEQALKQEKQLQQTRIELEERKRQEQRLADELAQKEEANIMMDKKFVSQGDEIEDKKKKLQKIYGKYQQAQSEITDMQDEITRERETYQEQLRELTRQLKLKTLVIDNFIPNDEINKVELRAQWSEEIDDWILPNLHLAGNSLRAKRPGSALGLKRPTSDYAKMARNFDMDLSPEDLEALRAQNPFGSAFNEEDDEIALLNLETQPNLYFVYKEDGIEREAEVQVTKEKKPTRMKSAMKKPATAARNNREISTANTTVSSGMSRPESGRRDTGNEENFPKAKGLVSKKGPKA
jgi:kinesin family protein 3/17